MKNIILTACIAFSAIANAQTQQGRSSVSGEAKLKEGTVVYERVIELQFRAPANSNIDFSNIPKSRKDQFEMKFGNNQSVWEMLPNMDENANTVSGSGPGGGRVVMQIAAGGDDIIYHNFETAKKIQQTELSGKNYLVEDSIKKLKWKLTGETKEVLGIKAQKAVAQNIGTRSMMAMENGEMKRTQVADTSTITAWFTTDIPVPAGPEYGGQLPGLILELNSNNGRVVYTAVQISPKVKVNHIKEPKKGKKISQADFALEREKMFEEMRKNMQGGTFRISTN